MTTITITVPLRISNASGDCSLVAVARHLLVFGGPDPMTGAAVVAYVLDCSLDIHDNHESGDAVYIEVTT